MKVELVSVTQGKELLTPEELIVYCARVSSPDNQHNNQTAPNLIKYLIKHRHWSPFEMVDMTVSIHTSRAIAAQLLRHRSFSFQEFSQRYAKVPIKFEPVHPRRAGTNNRQSSTDDLSPEVQNWFRESQVQIEKIATQLYTTAIEQGVAKECARFLLPQSIQTHLYMKGSVRSWIHYIEARAPVETQQEHRDVVRCINQIFKDQFPITHNAMQSTM